MQFYIVTPLNWSTSAFCIVQIWHSTSKWNMHVGTIDRSIVNIIMKTFSRRIYFRTKPRVESHIFYIKYFFTIKVCIPRTRRGFSRDYSRALTELNNFANHYHQQSRNLHISSRIGGENSSGRRSRFLRSSAFSPIPAYLAPREDTTMLSDRILPRTGLRPWPGAACIIRHGSKARFGVSMSWTNNTRRPVHSLYLPRAVINLHDRFIGSISDSQPPLVDCGLALRTSEARPAVSREYASRNWTFDGLFNVECLVRLRYSRAFYLRCRILVLYWKKNNVDMKKINEFSCIFSAVHAVVLSSECLMSRIPIKCILYETTDWFGRIWSGYILHVRASGKL